MTTFIEASLCVPFFTLELVIINKLLEAFNFTACSSANEYHGNLMSRILL